MNYPIWLVTAEVNGEMQSYKTQAEDDSSYAAGLALGIACGWGVGIYSSHTVKNMKIVLLNADQLDADERINLIALLAMLDEGNSLKTLPHAKVAVKYTYHDHDHSLTLTPLNIPEVRVLH